MSASRLLQTNSNSNQIKQFFVTPMLKSVRHRPHPSTLEALNSYELQELEYLWFTYSICIRRWRGTLRRFTSIAMMTSYLPSFVQTMMVSIHQMNNNHYRNYCDILQNLERGNVIFILQYNNRYWRISHSKILESFKYFCKLLDATAKRHSSLTWSRLIQ